jgi:TonB family protein
MKTSLFFIALIFSFLSYAGKMQSLDIVVVDAASQMPLKNIDLSFESNKKFEDATTDLDGKVTLEWKGKLTSLKITATDKSKAYQIEIVYTDPENLKEKENKIIVELKKPIDYDVLLAEFREIDAAIDAQLIVMGDSIIHNAGEKLPCKKATDSEYTGGMEALQKFIYDNLNYPQEAVENGEQGKVYLSFIVNADGQPSHVEVVKGVSTSLDYESVRFIYSMPKWVPAKCDGKGLRTRIQMPLMYTLE